MSSIWEYQYCRTQMEGHSPDHEQVAVVLLKFQMFLTGFMEDLAYVGRSAVGWPWSKAVMLLRGQG